VRQPTPATAPVAAFEPRTYNHSNFEEADKCHACGFTFTFFTRRHHCRACGHSVCGDHSRKTRLLRHRGAGGEPLRVCDDCDQKKSQEFQESLNRRLKKSQEFQESLNRRQLAGLAQPIGGCDGTGGPHLPHQHTEGVQGPADQHCPDTQDL
jgi:hypothetical protein